MQHKRYGNAVVIGGSMAGVTAARVLADHFQNVTIIERDARSAQPDFRHGVPQGRHAHGLLLGGLQVISKLFPDVRQALIDAGADVLNMGRDFRWYHFGVWKSRYDSALDGIVTSRPMIEWTIGEHLRKLPNVSCMDGWSVDSLIYAGNGVVSGVRAQRRDDRSIEQQLSADLVVDASGRGSQVPLQLKALGYERPEEEVVKVDVGYATRIFRVPAAARSWKALFVISQPPAKRGGLILPIEGNRWMCTLYGMHGDHPPCDEAGWLAFAKTLPVPDMYEALRQAEPVTEIVRYGYRASQRRYYEKLRRFPSGLLVLGDAICSFNPIYGQGMSAASMYADVLSQCLQERAATGWSLGDLWKTFFPRAARVADVPWQLSTSEDFRYAETIGERGAAMRFMHWYTGKIQVACGSSPRMTERFYEVMHLLKRPSVLFGPDVMWQLITPRAARTPTLTLPRTAGEGSEGAIP
jgi:2-polyprenyl-6-methoxyphenol hydroxylase-like FAD-dependent oxidoreductase